VTPLRFRIYPLRTLYFEVVVVGPRQLRRLVRDEYGVKMPEGATAMTCSWTWPEPAAKRWLGNLFFSTDHLSYGTIAHECCHAMVFWARRRWGREIVAIGGEHAQGNLMIGREEAVAVVVERLVEQIIRSVGAAAIEIRS